MSRLGERVGVLEAVTFSSVLAGAVAFATLLVRGRARRGIVRSLHQPWWMLTGAFFSLLIVFTVTYAGPRIGVAATVGILIAAQLVMGAAIDRFGCSARSSPAALAAPARDRAARGRCGPLAAEVIRSRARLVPAAVKDDCVQDGPDRDG